MVMPRDTWNGFLGCFPSNGAWLKSGGVVGGAGGTPVACGAGAGAGAGVVGAAAGAGVGAVGAGAGVVGAAVAAGGTSAAAGFGSAAGCWVSGLPQLPQKAAPSGNLVPQYGQNMGTSSSSHDPVNAEPEPSGIHATAAA